MTERACSFKLLKCVLVWKGDVRDVCLGLFSCVRVAARNSLKLREREGEFSVIYGVAKKKPKTGAANKQKKNTDNFHLFKTEPFPKQITFCGISREMTFPFLSALQGQQMGGGESEKKNKRKAFLDSVPSFRERVRGMAVLPSMSQVRDGGEPLLSREYYPSQVMWPK